MSEPVQIRTSTSNEVPFNAEKVATSLRNTGVQDDIIAKVVSELEKQLHDGITTKRIFKITHQLLKKHSPGHSPKYKLKQAVLDLGPSGYPFEHLVGEILKALGFNVKIGVMMEGKCVKHEVDVFAERDDLQFVVECKFHNRPGFKSDVKVPLYINSRFRDIAARLRPESKGKKINGWVVTNTRFTQDAIDYGSCAGLRLMSWDYPKGNSLRETMTRLDLHPITSLSSITKKEIKNLLDEGIVLCRTIRDNPDRVKSLLIDKKKFNPLMKEVNEMSN